jgi:hypothetical protein
VARITLGPLRGETGIVRFDNGSTVKLTLDTPSPGPVWIPADCVESLRPGRAA